MASPTPNKGYTYPAHGGAVNAWDTPLNTDFDYIDLNLGGMYPVTLGTSIVAVTYNSSGVTAPSTVSLLTFSASLAQNLYYPISGPLSANLDLAFPAAGGLYAINNRSSNAFTVSAYPSGSTSVAVGITQGGGSVLILSSTSAQLADSNFANFSPQSNNTLVGNVSGASAAPVALVMGTGLTPTSSTAGTATVSAPGFAYPGAFKNLAVKVASNTTVTVTADFVTMTDGTYYKTLAINSTINMATTGANALDTGAIAAGTSYATWVIAKADGTTACIASTSFTFGGITFPAGYTYAARIGAVRTAPAVAQLMGTWQLGRRAQYIVGLAQTSILPNIVQGVVGTFLATSVTYSSQSISNFVPSTASAIGLVVSNKYNNNSLANICVAPNTSYDGPATQKPPFIYNGNAANGLVQSGWMLLEGTTIAVVADATGGVVQCAGWEDNI